MEKVIEYLFALDVSHHIAPIISFFVALAENKGKHTLKQYIIVALIALSVAGIIEDFVPIHTTFISILIGVLSGVLMDDLYDTLTAKFPTIIDDILNTLVQGIKTVITKWLGKD